MTTTLDGVTKKKPAVQSAEQQAAVELVRLAKEQGLSLTGPEGLLKQLTKTVLETALNEEMTEHLGHGKNGQPVLRRSHPDRLKNTDRHSSRRVGSGEAGMPLSRLHGSAARRTTWRWNVGSYRALHSRDGGRHRLDR